MRVMIVNSEPSTDEKTSSTSTDSTAHKSQGTPFRKALWVIADWLWPSTMPMDAQQAHKVASRKQKERNEVEQRANNACRSLEEIKSAKESLEDLFEQENQRRQRVETRLISTVAFSAVAAPFVLSVFREISQSTLSNLNTSQKLIVVLLETYISLQLLGVVWHSLQGLKPRSYRAITPLDLLPADGESQTEQIRRYLSALLNCTKDNDKQNCIKVDKMALVYTAIRNYLVGIALLAFFMLSIQLVHSFPQEVAPQSMYETNQAVSDTPSEKTETKQENEVIDVFKIQGAVKTETNANEDIMPLREADIE